MSKKVGPYLQGSGSMQSVATSGWKTRLRNLTPMDWVAIVIFLIGVWIAIYTASLRHP